MFLLLNGYTFIDTNILILYDVTMSYCYDYFLFIIFGLLSIEIDFFHFYNFLEQ